MPKQVKDIMLPLEDYAIVSEEATILEAAIGWYIPGSNLAVKVRHRGSVRLCQP